jgi:transposase InsO family protein
VKLVRERGVSVAQASRDLDLHVNVLRKRVRDHNADPPSAFPGPRQMKPEQLEIERLCREVAKRKAEHDILKKAAAYFVMAIWRLGAAQALLHHSDQGSQYTSEQFQRPMADNGVTCSMSRSGNVWDNAAKESFFSSLKTERIARKTYRTRLQAKAEVFHYIERFYKAIRRHSTLGYLSPMDFERQANKP